MLDRTKPDSTNDDSDAPAAPAAPASASPPAKSRRARLRLPLMLGGIALVALGGAYGWLSSGRYVTTDDAYVRASKLMVTTDVSGLVSEVDVKEGQQVKAGDVLFRLDPHAYEIALADAKASLAETALEVDAMKMDYRRMLSDIASQENVVANDQATFNRYEVLIKANTAISQATFDQARFTLAADRDKLESLKTQAEVQRAKLAGDPDIPSDQHPNYLKAKAAVDEAQRQLDHATVRAPFDGVVTAVDALQPGLYLVSQTAALTNQGAIGLISTEHVWVDADLKETDLTYVKPGDPAEVTVDAYPSAHWTGTVESIAPASGSEFSILPAQNASGNWVKVVQRVPVRIRIDRQPGEPPLRAGMSTYVSIDTGHSRSLSELF